MEAVDLHWVVFDHALVFLRQQGHSGQCSFPPICPACKQDTVMLIRELTIKEVDGVSWRLPVARGHCVSETCTYGVVVVDEKLATKI